MGMTTQWLFKGTVIYTRFFDEISLQDIAESGLQHMMLLNEMPSARRVNFIVDTSTLEHYPRNLKALRNALNPAVFARTDWLILITEDYFHKHIAQIFARLFEIRFHVSLNLSDAYLFLQDRRSVPPPQNWPLDAADTMPTRSS
jgi:hypothetical protein